MVTHLGTIVERRMNAGGNRMVIECGDLARTTKPGDSVAVSGVCLTLVSAGGAYMQFDVVPETLDRTNLGALEPGNRVNLEPSLRLGEALGGHIVYGHVDATTRIETKMVEGPGARIRCAVPRGVAPMIVEKGFIALDGVSLTVARVGDGWFEVALVPETLARTTFGRKGAGANLNLEADPIARYVAAMLADRK